MVWKKLFPRLLDFELEDPDLFPKR